MMGAGSRSSMSGVRGFGWGVNEGALDRVGCMIEWQG